MVILTCSLIHTFSILSLQLKKLRRHNKSAIDLSNANPSRGHQELRQSTGHRNGESPLLKPTGIQLASKCMVRRTNGEHRKLIGVETMSLFGYKVWFVLLGCCKCFRIAITSYIDDYLMYSPKTKSSNVCIAMHLRELRYPIKFSLQYYVAIALALWRGAVARLSIHD